MLHPPSGDKTLEKSAAPTFGNETLGIRVRQCCTYFSGTQHLELEQDYAAPTFWEQSTWNYSQSKTMLHPRFVTQHPSTQSGTMMHSRVGGKTLEHIIEQCCNHVLGDSTTGIRMGQCCTRVLGTKDLKLERDHAATTFQQTTHLTLEWDIHISRIEHKQSERDSATCTYVSWTKHLIT